MAQITTTKVVEGPSVVVVKFDLLNNDGSGELTNQIVFSPSDLSPPVSNTKPVFRIMQIWYQLVYFDISVTTGGTPPNNILWALARDTHNHIDFRSFGGLTDTAIYEPPFAGINYGTLLFSTTGFSTAGSQGSIVMELRKL